MKDKNGIYYYPDPNDIATRVYVRQGEAEVEFRLWRNNMPLIWEKHGWIGQSAIKAAAAAYKDGHNGHDPLRFYDVEVAKALIREELRKSE